MSGLLLDAVCPPSGFFVDVVFLIVPADTVHQPFRPTIRPINQGKLHTLRDSLSKKGTVTYALTYHIHSNDFPLDLDVNTDSDEHAAYSTRPPQEHMKQDHLRSHTSTRFPKNTSLVDINMYLLQPATQC